MPSLMLDNALARLDAAIGQVEAAARRRIEAERARGNLETELALMQDDRARLAVELDSSLARLAQFEATAGNLDGRIGEAMQAVSAVLARLQAADEPSDDDDADEDARV